MKKIILLAVLASGQVWSARLVMEPFDQNKLAAMVGELSTEVRHKTVTSLTGPVPGFRVKSVFPKNEEAFVITCTSDYYNNSRYPSASNCTVEIDVNHQDYEKGYDELRGKFKDRNWTSSLFDVIPYGKPRKEIYSNVREDGIKFNGKKGLVFDYHFNCSTEDCILNFAQKKLKD